MIEEFDINKAVAEFMGQRAEAFYNTGKGLLKGATDKIRLHLQSSYEAYLSQIAEKYSKAKSFFIRHEPTHLYSFYIPVGLTCAGNAIERASIRDMASVNRFAVITGGAGSGKSILMRHLLLDTIRQKEKVPVFIELRELNHSEQSLYDLICDTLHAYRFTLDAEYIEKAIRAGHFAFFFDGYDELALSTRKTTYRQLQKLAKLYDENIMIISSRPDQEFSGWPSFSLFQIMPFNLDQACDLVQRLPFDLDLKSKFINDLREGLFEEHKSFLSNPLLLSIMLLTYGQSADIPNKLSIFYNQAYEALFQRHDALKGGFQRDRATKLDIQDFEKVFCGFCLYTYDKRLFQFPSSQALEFLERTKSLLNIEFDSNDYLSDTLQAVCLLVEDGLLISFSHRSFQEYFVARFIANSRARIQKKLIEKYSKNVSGDSVMMLLYEMDPELIEREYIIPGLDNLAKQIRLKKKVGITHFTRYIKSICSVLSIDEEMFGMVVNEGFNKPLKDFVVFTLRACGHLVGYARVQASEDERKKLLKKYGDNEIIRMDISRMSYRDEFIRDLAIGNEFFSLRVLNALFDIRSTLIKKHLTTERSLEELLTT